MKSRPWVLLTSCLLLGACRSPLGECGTDDISSIPIVFELLDDGRFVPQYAGQALTIQYCTSCHSASASAGARGLAPVGFNFDLGTLHDACADDPSDADCVHAQQVLADSDAIMFDYRQLSWNEVDQGRMPPQNFEDENNSSLYRTIDEDGRPADPLPSLSDPSSRELMRQWMACGGPVIGRVIGLDGEVPGNPPGTICRNGEGEGYYGFCAVGAPSATPLEPTWPSVFNFLSTSGCASTRCHGGRESPSMLDMDETYSAIVGETSSAPACGEFALVDAGSAATSLLMLKLDVRASGGELCEGEGMPPTGDPASLAVRDNIRRWINEGAMR